MKGSTLSHSHYLRLDCSDGRYKDCHSHQFACDHVIARPGLVLQLHDPLKRESVLEEIAIMIALKGIHAIRLLNHEDCGAYQLAGKDASREQLDADLETAATLLKTRFPDVTIKGQLVRLNGDDWTVSRPLIRV